MNAQIVESTECYFSVVMILFEFVDEYKLIYLKCIHVINNLMKMGMLYYLICYEYIEINVTIIVK